MSTRMRRVSQIALWLALGAAMGILAVAACGGPMNLADAGSGTDGGGGSACCSGPIEIQEPVDVNITNPSVTVDDTTPIDVNVTNTLPVSVTLPSPLPVVVAKPTFKGVTTAVFDGAGGWPTMNASCDLSFPGSRVCTDRALMDVYPAPVPGVDAWMIMTPYQADNSYGVLPAYGGASSGTSGFGANCTSGSRLFSYSGGIGYVLTATGEFDNSYCTATHPAACCGY